MSSHMLRHPARRSLLVTVLAAFAMLLAVPAFAQVPRAATPTPAPAVKAKPIDGTFGIGRLRIGVGRQGTMTTPAQANGGFVSRTTNRFFGLAWVSKKGDQFSSHGLGFSVGKSAFDNGQGYTSTSRTVGRLVGAKNTSRTDTLTKTNGVVTGDARTNWTMQTGRHDLRQSSVTFDRVTGQRTTMGARTTYDAAGKTLSWASKSTTGNGAPYEIRIDNHADGSKTTTVNPNNGTAPTVTHSPRPEGPVRQ